MRRYLLALSAFACTPVLSAAPYPVSTSTIAASVGEPIPIALWQPATGVDRAAIQRRIGGELVEFFGKNL